MIAVVVGMGWDVLASELPDSDGDVLDILLLYSIPYWNAVLARDGEGKFRGYCVQCGHAGMAITGDDMWVGGGLTSAVH